MDMEQSESEPHNLSARCVWEIVRMSCCGVPSLASRRYAWRPE